MFPLQDLVTQLSMEVAALRHQLVPHVGQHGQPVQPSPASLSRPSAPSHAALPQQGPMPMGAAPKVVARLSEFSRPSDFLKGHVRDTSAGAMRLSHAHAALAWAQIWFGCRMRAKVKLQ